MKKVSILRCCCLLMLPNGCKGARSLRVTQFCPSKTHMAAASSAAATVDADMEEVLAVDESALAKRPNAGDSGTYRIAKRAAPEVRCTCCTHIKCCPCCQKPLLTGPRAAGEGGACLMNVMCQPL